MHSTAVRKHLFVLRRRDWCYAQQSLLRSFLATNRLGVDKTEFKKYFQGSHKIHYLIGYLKGYDENSRSTYAKYLTVEVIKKLLDKGFDCTPLLISN